MRDFLYVKCVRYVQFAQGAQVPPLSQEDPPSEGSVTEWERSFCNEAVEGGRVKVWFFGVENEHYNETKYKKYIPDFFQNPCSSHWLPFQH